MNLGIKSIIGCVFSSFTPTHHVPVRYRYYADKLARGPIVKDYGYKERINRFGVLPRLKDADRLPIPVFRPGNQWSHEKVTEGQNDYIDILGGRKLNPSQVAYEVPKWLRGKKGNEMQLLILKRKMLQFTNFQYTRPTAWKQMQVRIGYLYRYLNRKTKTGLSKSQ